MNNKSIFAFVVAFLFLSLIFIGELKKVISQTYSIDRSDWYAVDGLTTDDFKVSDFDGESNFTLDDDGNPHVVWSTYNELWEGSLYYVWWNGSSWVDEDGDLGDPVTDSTFGRVYQDLDENFDDLFVEYRNGTVYIVWYDWNTNAVLIENSGSGFGSHIDLPIDAVADDVWGLYDAKLDDSGNWHFLYVTDYSFMNGTSNLRYMRYVSPVSYDEEIAIPITDALHTHWAATFDLDSNGDPHVAAGMRDANNDYVNIYYTYDTDTGTTMSFDNVEQVTTLAAEDRWYYWPVIRLDENDEGKMVYLYDDSDGLEQGTEVYYLEQGLDWDESNAVLLGSDEGLGAIQDVDMELDSSDMANISWVYATDDNLDDTYDVGMIYRYDTGSGFSVADEIYTYQQEAPVGMYVYLSIELDGYNIPYVLLSDFAEEGGGPDSGETGTVYLAKQNLIEEADEEEEIEGGCVDNIEYVVTYSFGDPTWWEGSSAPPSDIECTWEQTQGSSTLILDPESETITANSDTEYPLEVTTSVNFETVPTDGTEVYGLRAVCGSYTSEEHTFLAQEIIDCCITELPETAQAKDNHDWTILGIVLVLMSVTTFGIVILARERWEVEL